MIDATEKKTVNRESSVRLPWIDYLRGIAAFCVVIFHVRIDLWVGFKEFRADWASHGFLDRILSFLFFPAPFMGSAVMLFFLLSGFSIHNAYAGRKKSIDLPIYAIRRFFRIYPPYLAAIVLSLIVELTTNSFHVSDFYKLSPSSVYISSVFMLQNYLPPYLQIHADGALWSLPVEIEFYILFPLLYEMWRRWGTRNALLLVGGVSLAALLLDKVAHWQWLSANFAAYWIIWFAGAVLAELFHTKRFPKWYWYYYPVMLIGFGAGAYSTMRGGGADIATKLYWSAGYFLLLVRILSGYRDQMDNTSTESNSDTSRQSLFHRVFEWLGTISYSLYLVHLPLFFLSGALCLKLFGVKPVSPFWPIFACFAVLPFAWLFHIVVELPSHNLSRALARRVKTNAQNRPVPIVPPSAS